MTPPGAKIAIGLAAVLVLAAGCGSSGHRRAAVSVPSPPMTGTAAAPSTTTTTSQPGTRVAYGAPVNITGQPLPAITVSTATRGSCNFGSDVIVDVEVYRCFSGNGVYDPCWADTAGGVLCMPAPWSTTAVNIPTSGIAPGVDVQATELDFPWAVDLTSGARCVAVQGAHGTYQGKAIDFGCTGGPIPGLSLLRGIDRSGPNWTYQSIVVSGSTMVAGPTVSVATAWYAGPAPPTGSPACSGPSVTVTAGALDGIGTGSAFLHFRNTGATTCSLYGYPGVAALDPAGRQVAQAQRAPSSRGPATVYVPPGATASAEVEGNGSGASSVSCPTYPILLVTPPNTTASTQVPVGQLAICADFQVFAVTAYGGP